MDRSAPRPRPPFPYVDGTPAPLGWQRGLVVLAACGLAFAALAWLPRWMPGVPGSWAGALAFVGLQLAGLGLAVGPSWRTLFRRPRWRDLLIALACVPLAFALPALVAWGVVGSANLSANAVIQNAGDLAPLQVVNLFAVSGVQLLGEELITILPLLVLMAALHRARLHPWLVVGIAWVATALMFGALHLSTYHWHVGQALLVIGAARLVLTGVYLLTRNLWASVLAHVVNDWWFLAFVIVTARMAPDVG
ncbi:MULTISPECIES: CPBP family intramembrane glutamic endopeptidase [Luteimonas]|uniref:CPBP family intramembrane glutamic endopeptidase n=1 Tax=Luteimonas TaxID=83614 RepID=UPI000C7C5484|nr:MULTISPECIES: CPBP family intramembrane glutamic endopeptidase [Luteimonas]